jgi:hypothetical protein
MIGDTEGQTAYCFLTSVGFSASIMAAMKGLTHTHVEALLNSESEDDFDISDNKKDNSNGDVTVSDGRDKSNNDSSDHG